MHAGRAEAIGDRVEARQRVARGVRVRLGLGRGPQLADGHAERGEPEVVIGVRVRDDRERDRVVVERREHAGHREPGRRLGRQVARADEPAGIDEPRRAIGQLDDRGVALADIEKRDA